MLKTAFRIAIASVLACASAAQAQEWPTRSVTMVIPFAAGGPQDGIGRIVAQRMGEILGQQVIVENVGGAGGMTGADRVAKAEPDGYQFVLGSVGTHAQNQTLYKRPAYNAAADFTPVALIAVTPLVLITRKDFPANNLKEFIAYAKANQAKMSYGSAGAGSATHLGCVIVNSVMGTDITHVPYRGTGPAMQDLLGGRIDFLCDLVNNAKPQIDGGSVKAIAIMTKERSPALPNVPTGLEQGTKGFEAYTWSAIFLPKGAPAPIVKKLNAAVVQSMNTPEVRARLQGIGAQVVPDAEATPSYLAQFVKSEIEKWAGPIKASGVIVE
ncbi:MAG TPA: tripartite tricarboxylate transporter substrate-binding protein [Xanthobacteraceae bacterium]|nr:tripartite tricarboxylate transporter substrate-binding protein [Xanthobacteraceae bacterium]